jgi:hypothetical protein
MAPVGMPGTVMIGDIAEPKDDQIPHEVPRRSQRRVGRGGRWRG